MAGTSSGLAGAQGQKMLRRRQRPAGLTARGRAARRRAPGGSRALALLGASCWLVRGPPVSPPLAAGAPRMGCSPQPRRGGRRPRCPHAASSSETLLVAPGSLLVPRPPSPGARVLLPPPGACRAALRGSGAGRSAARRRRAGSVSRGSLRRGELTEHGARLARLARLGDRILRAPSERASVPGARHLPQGLPLPSLPLPPLPSPAPSRRRRLLPPPPAGPLLCWFHCAVARPAPASSRGRLDTLSL